MPSVAAPSKGKAIKGKGKATMQGSESDEAEELPEDVTSDNMDEDLLIDSSDGNSSGTDQESSSE